MNLLKLIIKRPTIIVVTFCILLGGGLFSYTKLGQELFPRSEIPIATIKTVYPGAGPAEVESSVSQKIEDAIASLENIDIINTLSMEGFSYITIEFKEGTNMNVAAQNAQRKINAIRSELPLTVKEPSVDIFDMNDAPIMNLSVTANMDETALYDIVKNEIQPIFEQISGIARINLMGGREREVQVNINEQRLAAYGLTISDVSTMLINSNHDFPAGKINNGEKQILIRLSGKYRTIEDIENIVIQIFDDGSIIKVSDVAFVVDGQKDLNSIYRYNGVNSIGIGVQKQLDANAVKVSDNIKERIERIEKQYADVGLSFNIAMNTSDFTIEATDSVIQDLFLAILFVAVAMLLFLHSFRNSLIVMVAIPTSLITTFIVMYLAGFTLNLMTLMALSLVIGILVDDAIVVIENIYRHMEMGKNRIQATLDGVREIGGSIITLTLVLAVVFIPVTFVDGMVGSYFRQFSVVIASATLISLFVSLTIIPLLSSRYAKLENINRAKITGKFISWFENLIHSFSLKMKNLLNWSFNHKLIVLGATILLFVSSLALLLTGYIGTEFADSGDRGEFFVRLELPKDATVQQTNQLTLQAEELLKQEPIITSIFATVGMEEDGQPQANKAEIHVKMVSYDKRTITDKEFARRIKLMLQKYIIGANITSVPTSIMGDASDAPIQFYVMGNNMDTVLNTSGRILDELRKIKGTTGLKVSVETGSPEINIRLNREKMSRLGVSQYSLGEAMNNAFTGNTDTKFKDNDREYDINIRLDQFDRKSKEDIENFSIINSFGEDVKLKQIAQVEESEAPSRLERHNRIGSVLVSCHVVGRPSGDVGDDVKQVIESMNLSDVVQVEYSGDMKNQTEGFASLGMALLISLILVYLIMVLLYNSYLYPFVILFSIPLAVIGVFFTLGLTMESLSVFAIIGIIILVGLVSRNAILVVDFANRLRENGVEVKEALLEATQQRFRPIIMTTISTVIGMLPIAIAQGPGAEWKNGLGWVLIGGLLSSMLLSLVIVPLVYYLFYRIQEKLGLTKKGKNIEIEGK